MSGNGAFTPAVLEPATSSSAGAEANSDEWHVFRKQDMRMCDYHFRRSPAPSGQVDHVSSLSENLGDLIENSEYSDITILVEGVPFKCHKVILAARSEYFRALLYGGMLESQPGTKEIELQNTSAKAFDALQRYMYTGRMNLVEAKEENLLNILGLAHQYGFVELESAISDYLKATLNIRNVCLIYDLANMYNLTSLCQVCKEFIDRNAMDILHSESFYSLSQSSVKELLSRDSFCAQEIDIFDAIYKWSEYNPGLDAGPILEAVRLPLMSMQDLLNIVRPTRLVSADAILDAIKVLTECRGMDLKYRGFLVPEENIATVPHGSQVVRGEMTQALLDGDTQTYDFDRGFTRHPIDGNNGQGIVVKLGQPYIINTIKMLLWDRDMRSYSYIIEVSMDDKDYQRVIDHIPSENVATIQASACVIEGVSRSRNALINGDIRNYDWDSGYTCHQLGSGAIVVQLAQPYMCSSMRILLWDCDERSYSYYVEVSTDQHHWVMVADQRNEACR
ncbi:BTBD9 [Acanthosepion pharaonis]|uniref:BTBD9 n=1 Tax=Acanthosepion pharaonis TaxID=158019 RepID=A0A812C0G9_ACAPH|nr:BTBD9 [Sepia pharaonis]